MDVIALGFIFGMFASCIFFGWYESRQKETNWAINEDNAFEVSDAWLTCLTRHIADFIDWYSPVYGDVCDEDIPHMIADLHQSLTCLTDDVLRDVDKLATIEASLELLRDKETCKNGLLALIQGLIDECNNGLYDFTALHVLVSHS